MNVILLAISECMHVCVCYMCMYTCTFVFVLESIHPLKLKGSFYISAALVMIQQFSFQNTMLPTCVSICLPGAGSHLRRQKHVLDPLEL